MERWLKMLGKGLIAMVGVAGVIIACAFVAQTLGLLPDFRDGGLSGSGGGSVLPYGSVVGNATVQYFTPFEQSCFNEILSRVQINNTSPGYTGVRLLEWYALRNASSHEYYQVTANFWCFQSGRGLDGDIDAYVEIYNKPNNVTVWVVEVSKATWWGLDVLLDGAVVASFPEVSADGNFTGYCTFEVTVGS